MNDRIVPLADVPGPSQPPEAAPALAEGSFSPDPLNTLKFQPALVEAASKVFDPEIPVNIYELGLIYDIDVDTAANVLVRMTLTAPACPVAGTLPGEVEKKIEAIPEVTKATVELVWDPPWCREMMSEAAQLQLGFI